MTMKNEIISSAKPFILILVIICIFLFLILRIDNSEKTEPKTTTNINLTQTAVSKYLVTIDDDVFYCDGVTCVAGFPMILIMWVGEDTYTIKADKKIFIEKIN